MAKRNRLLQGLLTGLCLGFYRITVLLPLPMARLFGTALASLAYYVVPRIRKVGLANLDTAYGNSLSRREKLNILKESVRNLGLVAAEFGRIPQVAVEGKDKWFRVEGEENLDRTRGGVFMSAHLGNWEWMAPAGGAIGLRSVIIVRGFDDPRLDDVVDAVRKTENVETIYKDAATGPLLKKLKEGWIVGILADQNPRENGVPVKFFGAPAWATIGPALIAQRARVPVYPVSMVRDLRGIYTLRFHPPVDLCSTGSLQEDIAANTQRCQDAIEMMVRQNPGQWLWFHRRWRKRERLEKEWAERTERNRSPLGVAENESDTKEESPC